MPLRINGGPRSTEWKPGGGGAKFPVVNDLKNTPRVSILDNRRLILNNTQTLSDIDEFLNSRNAKHLAVAQLYIGALRERDDFSQRILEEKFCPKSLNIMFMDTETNQNYSVALLLLQEENQEIFNRLSSECIKSIDLDISYRIAASKTPKTIALLSLSQFANESNNAYIKHTVQTILNHKLKRQAENSKEMSKSKIRRLKEKAANARLCNFPVMCKGGTQSLTVPIAEGVSKESLKRFFQGITEDCYYELNKLVFDGDYFARKVLSQEFTLVDLKLLQQFNKLCFGELKLNNFVNILSQLIEQGRIDLIEALVPFIEEKVLLVEHEGESVFYYLALTKNQKFLDIFRSKFGFGLIDAKINDYKLGFVDGNIDKFNNLCTTITDTLSSGYNRQILIKEFPALIAMQRKDKAYPIIEELFSYLTLKNEMRIDLVLANLIIDKNFCEDSPKTIKLICELLHTSQTILRESMNKEFLKDMTAVIDQSLSYCAKNDLLSSLEIIIDNIVVDNLFHHYLTAIELGKGPCMNIIGKNIDILSHISPITEPYLKKTYTALSFLIEKGFVSNARNICLTHFLVIDFRAGFIYEDPENSEKRVVCTLREIAENKLKEIQKKEISLELENEFKQFIVELEGYENTQGPNSKSIGVRVKDLERAFHPYTHHIRLDADTDSYKQRASELEEETTVDKFFEDYSTYNFDRSRVFKLIKKAKTGRDLAELIRVVNYADVYLGEHILVLMNRTRTGYIAIETALENEQPPTGIISFIVDRIFERIDLNKRNPLITDGSAELDKQIIQIKWPVLDRVLSRKNLEDIKLLRGKFSELYQRLIITYTKERQYKKIQLLFEAGIRIPPVSVLTQPFEIAEDREIFNKTKTVKSTILEQFLEKEPGFFNRLATQQKNDVYLSRLKTIYEKLLNEKNINMMCILNPDTLFLPAEEIIAKAKDNPETAAFFFRETKKAINAGKLEKNEEIHLFQIAMHYHNESIQKQLLELFPDLGRGYGYSHVILDATGLGHAIEGSMSLRHISIATKNYCLLNRLLGDEAPKFLWRYSEELSQCFTQVQEYTKELIESYISYCMQSNEVQFLKKLKQEFETDLKYKEQFSEEMRDQHCLILADRIHDLLQEKRVRLATNKIQKFSRKILDQNNKRKLEFIANAYKWQSWAQRVSQKKKQEELGQLRSGIERQIKVSKQFELFSIGLLEIKKRSQFQGISDKVKRRKEIKNRFLNVSGKLLSTKNKRYKESIIRQKKVQSFFHKFVVGLLKAKQQKEFASILVMNVLDGIISQVDTHILDSERKREIVKSYSETKGDVVGVFEKRNLDGAAKTDCFNINSFLKQTIYGNEPIKFNDLPVRLNLKLACVLEKLGLINNLGIKENLEVYGSSLHNMAGDIDVLVGLENYELILAAFKYKNRVNHIGIIEEHCNVKVKSKSFRGFVRISESEVVVVDFTLKKGVWNRTPITEKLLETWLKDPKNLLRLLKIHRTVFFDESAESETLLTGLIHTIKTIIKSNFISPKSDPNLLLLKLLTGCPLQESTKVRYEEFKHNSLTFFNETLSVLNKKPIIVPSSISLFEGLCLGLKNLEGVNEKDLKELSAVVGNSFVASKIYCLLNS